MTTDPRRLALDILLDCHSSRKTLDASLEEANPQLDRLPQKDKNLSHALVFGVLRNRGFLDYLITQFSDKPLQKLDLPVVYLLRIALFQLVFLDRVPEFAVIHTTVEIAKTTRAKKAAGFLNAVLRKAISHPDLLDFSKFSSQTALNRDPETLAVKHSLPQWLMKRWMEAYARDDTEKICASLHEIPPTVLRINTLKTTKKELFALWDAKKTEYQGGILPESVIMNQKGISVTEIPGFQEGYFQIQDQAAQLVSHYLDPQKGERILDACAGLGGKTFHMAQLMENQGTITAMDTGKAKLERLAEESRRLGITMVDTLTADVRKVTTKNFPAPFDRVLVDAPCTGLGVLRRNPDSRWKRSVKQILLMASRQKKILNAAANLVRPGGVLVFAVCSCEWEETIGVMESFLSKRIDFAADTSKDDSPFWASFVQTPGSFATYPSGLAFDGFFAARFKRKNSNHSHQSK